MLLSPYSTDFWQCNYPVLLPFTRIFILAPVISFERDLPIYPLTGNPMSKANIFYGYKFPPGILINDFQLVV